MVAKVWDDLKLRDDRGKVSKPNRVVDGSIPGYEIVPLLDRKLAKLSSASCFPQKEKEKEKRVQ